MAIPRIESSKRIHFASTSTIGSFFFSSEKPKFQTFEFKIYVIFYIFVVAFDGTWRQNLCQPKIWQPIFTFWSLWWRRETGYSWSTASVACVYRTCRHTKLTHAHICAQALTPTLPWPISLESHDRARFQNELNGWSTRNLYFAQLIWTQTAPLTQLLLF